MLLEEKLTTGSVEFIEKRSILVVKTKLLAMPVTWTIPMERLESTADVKCEFLVKQMEKLTASNKQLTTRVKSLEELISGTPDKVERPLFAAVNIPNLTLSADRKTVTRNSGSGWQGFISEQSILAMGNRFTLTLTNIGSNILVGVAKRGTDLANGFHSKAGSWMLYIVSGSTYYLYSNGIGIAINSRIPIANGSQLTVRLDPINEVIYFQANGCLLYTLDVPKPFSDLYAAVEFNEANQSVSFM